MNKLKKQRINKKLNTFINILNEIKSLSVSSTKQVACIALHKNFNKIAAFGYNGSYSGAGIDEFTGTEEESLDPGESGFIHAEINTIAKFKEHDPENYIILLTLSPCKMCTKVLVNAGFKYIYWLEEYRETDHLKIFKECNILSGNVKSLADDYERFISS